MNIKKARYVARNIELNQELPNSRFNQNLEGSIFAWLFVGC